MVPPIILPELFFGMNLGFPPYEKKNLEFCNKLEFVNFLRPFEKLNIST